MIGELVALAALFLAAIPAALFLRNLQLYRPCPKATESDPSLPGVSVLIPARNEENSIQAAVESVLANQGVDLELLVLDDHSEDRTGEILARLARQDARLRLPVAPPLPEGWCGKQFACAVLASEATRPVLVFLDADVRLAPDALARLLAALKRSGADLLSGVPRQETGTLLEKLVIPLIHFLLLGFLPMDWMRRSTHPAFAAGCGQLFVAWRSSYARMGGHAAIRSTLHDGLLLPRAFRKAGLKTDLCDATDLAVCRMYRGAAELWRGLAKNAREGLASPWVIGPATLLLFGGQVLPGVLLALTPWLEPQAAGTAVVAALLAWLPRFLGVWRFRQSLLGAVLHPLGVAVLLLIQWQALLGSLAGYQPAWKGRRYPSRAIQAGPEHQGTS
jgi:hypothetical protein